MAHGSHAIISNLPLANAVQAIAEEKQRVLLTLATGTGKTFIAFQLHGSCSKAAGRCSVMANANPVSYSLQIETF